MAIFFFELSLNLLKGKTKFVLPQLEYAVSMRECVHVICMQY